MRIAHTELEPIKGVSGREKTAFTMKTIKQLLEEEAAKVTQVPVSPKPTEAVLKTTTAPVVEAKKTVPPMPLPVQPKVAAAPEPAPRKVEALPEISPTEDAEQSSKRRSLLGRLIGG